MSAVGALRSLASLGMTRASPGMTRFAGVTESVLDSVFNNRLDVSLPQ